jgi:hypothetical protein
MCIKYYDEFWSEMLRHKYPVHVREKLFHVKNTWIGLEKNLTFCFLDFESFINKIEQQDYFFSFNPRRLQNL